MEEVLTQAPLVSGEPEKKKGSKENLKQRAYLNSLTSLIDYAGVQITGILVSPFIVQGLGSANYGVWKMLGQMTGYATLADSRATQVLKWTVAKKKDIASDEELRSDAASALFVTAFILPLILVAGAVISWYAPVITKTAPAYYDMVRITCSFLIFALVISRFFDLFEAVLRGMNLGYKRMGFRAGIVMLGGGLKVLAITQGFGIQGLAAVQVLVALVTGITFYTIVRKNVGWFGFGKTNVKKVMGFARLSGWNMANTTTDTMLTSTDKVLLGMLAGPVLVSSYALTVFLALAVQGLVSRVIIGVMPGMGKLLGLQDYEKINRVRAHINNFIFITTTASGVTIILFNQSFLNNWIGDGFFAGHLANAVIVLTMMQDTFIKHDGYVITASLDLKKKVAMTCVAAVVFIGLGFLLIKEWGILGLCLSMIAGKFLLFVGQRHVLRKKIHQTLPPLTRMLQPMAITALLLAVAYYGSLRMPMLSWLELLLWAPLVFVASFFFFYALGLRGESRREQLKILRSIKFFKSN